MASVPIIYVNERKAEWAFEVHQALIKTEAATPALRNNPRWRRLREAAFQDFELAFVATGVTR